MATQETPQEAVQQIGDENTAMRLALEKLPELARRNDDIGLLARAILGSIGPDRSVDNMVSDGRGFQLREV